jgi:hypothetical protein
MPEKFSPASAFRPVFNSLSPASAFRHQGQSGTAGHTVEYSGIAQLWFAVLYKKVHDDGQVYG